MRINKQSGLTMVEITISIIIIGLLIAGILKGGQVVTNAKVVSLVNTIKAVEGVVVSFEDFYGFKPGDIASNKVPGCTAANFCNNISSTVESGIVNDDIGGKFWSQKFSPTTPNESESFLFWKHLALADMISDIDTNANLATPQWGVTNPSTPFGGGLEFYEDVATTVGFAGELLRISDDGIFPGGNARGILNPLITRSIDTKMDDGDPNNGLVFADYGTNNNQCKDEGPDLGGGEDTDGISTYTNNRNAVCTLFIGF